MDRASDILRIISARKAAGEPFALATVVRTVAATAAKAGAKAVILPDGTISEGWIGGGSQGGQRCIHRRKIAPRFRTAAGLARPARSCARRRAGWGALCQKHVPERGHDGYFRGARLAAISDRHLWVEPGCHRCCGVRQTCWICGHSLR